MRARRPSPKCAARTAQFVTDQSHVESSGRSRRPSGGTLSSRARACSSSPSSQQSKARLNRASSSPGREAARSRHWAAPGISIVGAGTVGDAENNTQMIADAKQALLANAAVYNNRKWDEFRLTYTEDAVLLPPNHDPVRGRDAINELHRDVRDVVARLTSEALSWSVRAPTESSPILSIPSRRSWESTRSVPADSRWGSRSGGDRFHSDRQPPPAG